ncbi:P-loop containing nucleoside triphosphate hydrolase protein [Acaromyces ingoldii]|uniref:P-loop containing nucleoside triphosphate hydrolase protein n=1 Tax=Acaromyces ingoldii TaxID=215250 RepID=A0A316YN51_9BASI|nr:P-loop containing nucleoside triphosphate hydrolase protein [Acaromyces ingoldii]PWN89493.1 P-loop containing nucleoside triphosphate hydrolase protein [Acaromyces ingoldii]
MSLIERSRPFVGLKVPVHHPGSRGQNCARGKSQRNPFFYSSRISVSLRPYLFFDCFLAHETKRMTMTTPTTVATPSGATVGAALLSVRGLSLPSAAASTASSAQPPWTDLGFDLHEGELLLVRGPSGRGKTTLLKALADLVEPFPAASTQVRYRGRQPHELVAGGKARWAWATSLSSTKSASSAAYRSKVIYVAQRPAAMGATPEEFLEMVLGLKANRRDAAPRLDEAGDEERQAATALDRPQRPEQGSGWHIDDESLSALQEQEERDTDKSATTPATAHGISREWGIAAALWSRNWSSLSGGEAQRISLAIGLHLAVPGDSVLLLDEPTSALDAQTTALVEATLAKMIHAGLAVVCITHSDEQQARLVNLTASNRRRVRILYLE